MWWTDLAWGYSFCAGGRQREKLLWDECTNGECENPNSVKNLPFCCGDDTTTNLHTALDPYKEQVSEGNGLGLSTLHHTWPLHVYNCTIYIQILQNYGVPFGWPQLRDKDVQVVRGKRYVSCIWRCTLHEMYLETKTPQGDIAAFGP